MKSGSSDDLGYFRRSCPGLKQLNGAAFPGRDCRGEKNRVGIGGVEGSNVGAAVEKNIAISG